jgi:toxin ParE1/3/4
MYRLSNLAAEDFSAIYEYTLLHYGVLQADVYTEHLERTFHLLATSPYMGYECDEIAKGLRRHDHHQHVIFYRPQEKDIFIIRILHQRMDPVSHVFEPDV